MWLEFFRGACWAMPYGFEGEERDAVGCAVAAMQKYKLAFRVIIVLGRVIWCNLKSTLIRWALNLSAKRLQWRSRPIAKQHCTEGELLCQTLNLDSLKSRDMSGQLIHTYILLQGYWYPLWTGSDEWDSWPMWTSIEHESGEQRTQRT